MQTEACCSTRACPAISFYHLIITKTKLGFQWLADQITAALLFTRVVSKRDQLREVFHFIYQTEIVEIENATHVCRAVEFCAWGVVRRNHDVITLRAGRAGQRKFRQR